MEENDALKTTAFLWYFWHSESASAKKSFDSPRVNSDSAKKKS